MEASAPRPITAATESEYRVSTGSPTDPRRIACQPVNRLGGVGWGGVGWIGVGLGWAELGWAGLGWAGWVRIGCKRRKGAAPSSRPSLPHASAPQALSLEPKPRFRRPERLSERPLQESGRRACVSRVAQRSHAGPCPFRRRSPPASRVSRQRMCTRCAGGRSSDGSPAAPSGRHPAAARGLVTRPAPRRLPNVHRSVVWK